MNIVKGCIIECELLCGYAGYLPLKVEVMKEEYITTPGGDIIHLFEVKVLEHFCENDKRNQYFPLNEVVAARAGDLYNGRIVEYPEGYERLCEEKAQRKARVETRASVNPH
jgi:hypothetical protein